MLQKRAGNSLETGPACQAFRSHLAEVESASEMPRTWAQVENGFLKAMENFDTEVIAGRATEGERQNGKGDYFNELLALVIEHASGWLAFMSDQFLAQSAIDRCTCAAYELIVEGESHRDCQKPTFHTSD